MIKTIFFDLDGTLLPVNQQIFVETYFGEMVKAFAKKGFDPKLVFPAVMSGTKKMRLNEGPFSNNVVFLESFKTDLGGDPALLSSIFEEFYSTTFDLVKQATTLQPLSNQLIKFLKSKGIQLVLATNPLFPAISTHKRIQWAGLQKEDFSLITTIENGYASKPNPKYFKNLMTSLSLTDPKAILMIGNDATEDLAALSLGIETFLLTDDLINKDLVDLTTIPKGNFQDLIRYLERKLGFPITL
jgi:FMN phosphatase YigB (HAD superfamily)